VSRRAREVVPEIRQRRIVTNRSDADLPIDPGQHAFADTRSIWPGVAPYAKRLRT
jgi:hypothetical protein